MKHVEDQLMPADTRDIIEALKQEYGTIKKHRQSEYWAFDKHVYVGRAIALLGAAMKLGEKAKPTAGSEPLREALAELDALESAFGECDRLRAKIIAIAAAKPREGSELTDAEIDAAAEASDWPKSMLAPVIRQKLRDFARALIAAQEQRHD